MDAAMKLACQWNEQGLYLLQRGDVVQASKAFQEGLAILKQAFSHGDIAITADHMQNTVIPQSLKETTMCLSGLDQSSNDAAYYVYSSPLQTQDYLMGQDIDSYYMLTFAQLLFNLALTKHHRAKTASLTSSRSKINSESSFSELMASATRLYQTLLNLLEVLIDESAAARTLCLLALNNKIEIHKEQSQFQEAAQCCQMLTEFLMYLQEMDDAQGGSGDYRRCCCAMQTLDMDQIGLNVLTFQQPFAARAA